MDNGTSIRRNHATKKGNKENTGPMAPFYLKSNQKETLAKKAPLKARATQADCRSEPVTQKEVTVQKAAEGAGAPSVKLQKHGQVILTQQVVKHRNGDTEAPKKTAAVPSSKSTLGMYKGKIVQSKIGSIWRSGAAVGVANDKPVAHKMESHRVGNVRRRSRSAAKMPRHGERKPAPIRSKSVSDGPAHMSKVSAVHPTAPVNLNPTSCRNTAVAPTKPSGSQSSKPRPPVMDKVNKPPVSAVSQYRYTVESAEERRMKLAGWLASKGRTLKRPAMMTAAASNPQISTEPKPEPKPQPEPAEQSEPEATPEIMNITLDLLENSDTGPQDRISDIVVNLCDALEAMATPSMCHDEVVTQTADGCDDKEMECAKPVEGCAKMQTELYEDVGEQVKDEAEESDEEAGSHVMEATPQRKDASMIKYSVTTTPYLQSVKKTIEGEVATSASGRKSNIKDLKFLTPVRRSCRIQRNSSHLPKMLVDPDPCVSSLDELVKLDDDPNAYIYRKNPALLPHQSSE
ncbi:uncharacterized protein KZ484_007697 isoform 1-T2 [Pholidichthys leucotaenia]